MLAEHAGIVEHIHADAGWVRAVADHAAGVDRPLRLVTLTDATTAGGRSRAQASAQLARAGQGATGTRVGLRRQHGGRSPGAVGGRSASSSPTWSAAGRRRRSPVRSSWRVPVGWGCAAIRAGRQHHLRRTCRARLARRHAPGDRPVRARPDRVVDAHVHLWDPARTDWYPYLSGGQRLSIGDVSGMARLFDVPTYRSEAAGWNVVKLVNVAAATGHQSIEETLELDRRADVDGHPDAIVGGLPPTGSPKEAVDLLDRQMAASRFRGVRPMGVFDGPLPPPDVLRAVQERGLLFELMAHADQLQIAAAGLAAFADLAVVVEHTGWPRSGSDEEFALWSAGIDALAGLGDNVVCKLSGLAMPLGTVGTDAFAPWIEHAIDAFGVDRCMFASNFPVDGRHGTFDELYSTFADVTAGLDDESRDKLFAANAERVYRC